MPTQAYRFDANSDVEAWLNKLVGSDSWQTQPWRETEGIFYDTFDWRLYSAGMTLEGRADEGRRHYSLWSLKDEFLIRCLDVEEPGFARDLPEGPLRQQLEPLLKMRRLLPRAVLRNRRKDLALLNSDGKTVLQMAVSVNRRVVDPRGEEKGLPAILRLLPIKGYTSAIRRIGARLDQDPGLQRMPVPPLLEALDALGKRPADYSSKLFLELSPQCTAEQALRAVLLHLLAVIQANLDGTCKDIDSEFLHDLRVAVRRTRSALGQIKGVLPEDDAAPFREGFAWLGSITGPTRDLDVYLLNFADYLQRLPENHRLDLAAFHHFLQQRQTEEQKLLSRQLRSPRCTRLLADWATLLHKESATNSAPPEARRPIREVADRRIWKLFRRCVREGQAISSESPAEALHELRKTCKKLRYLLEFFQSLYPADAITERIKALKGLQDNLGDFNDFEVQSEAMLDFGLQMAQKQQATPATLLAMGMLAESLRHQQFRTRQEFEQRFAAFCSDSNTQQFRRLFGKTKPKGASSP